MKCLSTLVTIKGSIFFLALALALARDLALALVLALGLGFDLGLGGCRLSSSFSQILKEISLAC
jgi:hypothetical protein